jgi:hypothetical protein
VCCGTGSVTYRELGREATYGHSFEVATSATLQQREMNPSEIYSEQSKDFIKTSSGLLLILY